MKDTDKLQSALNMLVVAQSDLSVLLFLFTGPQNSLLAYDEVVLLLLRQARRRLEGSLKSVAAVLAERECES